MSNSSGPYFSLQIERICTGTSLIPALSGGATPNALDHV